MFHFLLHVLAEYLSNGAWYGHGRLQVDDDPRGSTDRLGGLKRLDRKKQYARFGARSSSRQCLGAPPYNS